jgi:lambda family phage portal protein
MAKAAVKKPSATPAAPAKFRSFDAGKNNRRLRGLTTSTVAINTQIRAYGKTVLARSRYLAANNPYAAAAKETFVSALVGAGIKPSSLVDNASLKKAIQEAWLEWTDEADADGLTDLYGVQAIVAAEMFEAGECFVRIRARRPEDGLSVPMQLQILPAEMLDLSDNRVLGSNGSRVEMGIEFDAIGRRVAYHFWRQHPGSDQVFPPAIAAKTIVPADEVLHLYRPIRAGQVRGIPHTLSAIVVAAIMDCYDDAELERKRTAALFGGFITRPAVDNTDHPLEEALAAADADGVSGGAALEPGALVDLADGEDIKFAAPADVGGSYEAFQYRSLLRMAAGFGVPYAAMTGDLRQTSYGSIRAGLVEFRRRIEAMQHAVMVFQFCRPVWRRWLDEAVLSPEVTLPLSLSDYVADKRAFRRAKWITPKWEWIDPLKDRQAEAVAVDNGWKSRSDVIEAEGYDPEETDARIAADKARADKLGLQFPQMPQPSISKEAPPAPGNDPSSDPAAPPADQPPEDPANGA